MKIPIVPIVPIEVEDKFFEGESTEFTLFGVNTAVVITSGLFRGQQGAVLSIVEIQPVVKYTVELSDGREILVEENNLKLL